MLAPLLALALAAPFPLPTVDGKPLAVTQQQKSFRLPMRFEKVRDFYREQLKGAQVQLTVTGAPGERVLRLVNRSKTDSWTRATVTERATETVVDVTPVLVMGEETVEGNGRPLVVFVFNRSGEVDKALGTIDHTEQLRAK